MCGVDFKVFGIMEKRKIKYPIYLIKLLIEI